VHVYGSTVPKRVVVLCPKKLSFWYLCANQYRPTRAGTVEVHTGTVTAPGTRRVRETGNETADTCPRRRLNHTHTHILFV